MNAVAATQRTGTNPFPGLRPFQQGEEEYFFGRERQTDAMVDKLAATRFLAVIGSSGCGKSSLVNCGLRTALRSGLMAKAGTHWRMAQCRPAGSPIASLASALAADGVLFDQHNSETLSLESIIDADLRMSKLGIADVFEQAHLSESTNLLIIIDQFEELFRYGQIAKHDSPSHKAHHDEATAFINLLLCAREQTRFPIHIVITMRSDFLGDCAAFEGLAETINEGQYLVPRMTREERRIAIAGPVGVSGSSIDPVLLTRLVNDLGDDPDQLSILQHALNRLWSRRDELSDTQTPLNLDHYHAVGSMSRALDIHAESAYSELDAVREQSICEKLFKSLTNKATDSRGVRRPTKFSTLCELTDSSIAELTSVINVFRRPDRSFLMPPHNEPLNADSVVDISHESLMRMWKRLLNWADEEAQSTQTYLRLADTAELHANDQAGLWRDPDLQVALEWRLHSAPNKTWASRIRPGFEQAMQFLDKSREASDTEKAEELRLAEQERELHRSRAVTDEQAKRLRAQEKAARKHKQVIVLVAGGLLVTTFLTLYALDQRNTAKEKLAEITKERANKKNVVEFLADTTKSNSNLIISRTYSEKLQHVLWQLVSENGLADHDIPSSQSFTNRLDETTLILKLNEDGHQTSPTILDPGQSTMMEGYVNQVWIAREAGDGRVLEAGIMSVENSPTVFEKQ